jgi:acyl-CoA thioesterase II
MRDPTEAPGRRRPAAAHAMDHPFLDPSEHRVTYTATDLLELLDLEPIEHNIYRGHNRDIGSGRIFGGQVLAQALVAARRTVDEDRPVHSVHGYFILAGDLELPVVYFVDRLRDGRSFATRRVTAIQHGQAIFNMAASFHRLEEGPEHQIDLPDVPPPEGLRSELDLIRDRIDSIPPGPLRAVLTQDRPLDIRPLDPADPFDPEPREPRRRFWVRSVGDVGDDPVNHQAVLAYASDYGLLGSALRPHGLSVQSPEVMVASLDHAIWFHAPFRIDEWLLYDMESPVAGGARAFTRGAFYTRSGTLVASVAQEGLVRLRRR